MVTCSVPGCNSSKKRNINNYSFHTFPIDSVVRKKWLRMVHRKNWTPKKYSVICSKHFESLCFSEGAEKRVKLCSGSIPTLFLPTKKKSNPTPNENIKSMDFKEKRNINSFNHCPGQNISMKSIKGNFEETMIEEATVIPENLCEVKEEMSSECRTCLQTLSSDDDLYYIFQSWASPWEGVEDTIAEALHKITHIQLSDMDPHSKVICGVCCQKLHTACLFASLAQQSDYTLQQRYLTDQDSFIDTKWPKPIQIDKNIPFNDEINIKQEVLSDEEYDGNNSRQDENHSEIVDMEIKIEPVELIQPNEISVTMNGHYDGTSPKSGTPEIAVNGDDKCPEHYNVMVKEEPVSDNESVGTDLSLDCMLCAKVFKSVSGLKAHVIAYHSYKSVRRKAANETSPVKRQKHGHVCVTCRRSFATSTDLMVHETCHNKSVCYGCNEKFDSFEKVMQHRLTCKAVNKREHGPIKTLEDVQRPVPSSTATSDDNSPDLLKCKICGEHFTDNYYMNIHLEIHHPTPATPTLNEEEMEVETLESLFTERA